MRASSIDWKQYYAHVKRQMQAPGAAIYGNPAANEVYGEITAKNEDFKKVYESIKAFRADSYLWFQLSENTFDTYMMIQQRKKTL